jgi:tetratricopeptide (TPR) repeat protein/NAD-dependent SIR2 family protein deacetylase
MELTIESVVSRTRLREFDHTTFLAGSGISFSSGIPTGWNFNHGMAELLAADAEELAEVRSLLVSGYASSHNAVRFEQVMFVLRERLDPELDVLRCFDVRDRPTGLHRFLAGALRNGAYVFTTNFDSLIEAACVEAGSRVLQVYVEDAADEPLGSPGCSFERFEKSDAHEAVLKLHGTLYDMRGGDAGELEVRRLIGATLDKIGARGRAARLEPHKEAVLRRALTSRVLCVVGYSGADDFDVLPSLVEALPHAAGLVWFRHEDREPIACDATDDAGALLLPRQIQHAAQLIPTFVITGRTTSSVEAAFGIALNYVGEAPAEPLAARLANLPSYRGARPYLKKLIAARLAEEAMRLEMADRWYTDAARLALRRDSTSYAYALFRQGHLARERGRIADALALLHRALRVFRKRNDTRNLPLVLNAIGSIFLQRGPLRKAASYYQQALRAAREIGSRRFEATVLNNLGLVEKRRGRYEQAISYYEAAIAIDSDIRERIGMCRELGNKAAALILLKRYKEALVVYDESVEMERLLGRRDLLAVSMLNRGIAYRRTGRTEEASRAAGEALELERELGRKHGVACCLSLLGGIAADRGDWQEAIDKYTESIGFDLETNHIEGLATDFESLAETYAASGDMARAREAYAQSDRYYMALGNKSKLKEIAQRLAALPHA